MSTQRAYGLQYIRKFPKLAKFIIYYENYEGKDRFISDEASVEFIEFCRCSSEIVERKECFMCKTASQKQSKIEISEFWHACMCIATEAGIDDAIETNESGVRVWRKTQQN